MKHSKHHAPKKKRSTSGDDLKVVPIPQERPDLDRIADALFLMITDELSMKRDPVWEVAAAIDEIMAHTSDPFV